ncbi:MAG: hypothetical protein WKF36_10575 [Candidatus Nitrosocosmicus sp.]
MASGYDHIASAIGLQFQLRGCGPFVLPDPCGTPWTSNENEVKEGLIAYR